MPTTTTFSDPQALPSWLSYSSFTITSDATVIITETIVNLPLTYYGPSIPLGTDGVWVYGGLTSPASTPTPKPQTPPLTQAPSHAPTPSPTSSNLALSTESTTLTTHSTTATSIPLTSTSQSSPLSSAAISTSTGAPPTSIIPSPVSFVARPGLPVYAIVLIAVLGTLVLLSLCLLCAFFIRRRRRRQQNDSGRPMTFAGINFVPVSLGHRHARVAADEEAVNDHDDDDWEMVPGSGPAGTANPSDAIMTTHNVPPSHRAALLDRPIIPPGDVESRSSSPAQPPGADSGNDSSRSLFYARKPELDLDHEHFDDHAEDAPLVALSPPPPRTRSSRDDSPKPSISDPTARRANRGPIRTSADNPASELDEGAVLTATRVRVDSPPTSMTDLPGAGGARWGLSAALVRLSRVSWLRGLSGSTGSADDLAAEEPSGSGNPGFLEVPTPSPRRRTFFSRSRDDRPISTISGRSAVSGHSVYHSARSQATSAGQSPTAPEYRELLPDDEDHDDVLDTEIPQAASPFRVRGGTGDHQYRSLSPGPLDDEDVIGASSFTGVGLAGGLHSRTVLDALEEEPPRSSLQLSEDRRDSDVSARRRLTLGQEAPLDDAGSSYSHRLRTSAPTPEGSQSTNHSGSRSASSRSSKRKLSSSDDEHGLAEGSTDAGQRARRRGRNPLFSQTFGNPTWLTTRASLSAVTPGSPTSPAHSIPGSPTRASMKSRSTAGSPLPTIAAAATSMTDPSVRILSGSVPVPPQKPSDAVASSGDEDELPASKTVPAKPPGLDSPLRGVIS